jgi:hypothetical protein
MLAQFSPPLYNVQTSIEHSEPFVGGPRSRKLSDTERSRIIDLPRSWSSRPSWDQHLVIRPPAQVCPGSSEPTNVLGVYFLSPNTNSGPTHRQSAGDGLGPGGLHQLKNPLPRPLTHFFSPIERAVHCASETFASLALGVQFASFPAQLAGDVRCYTISNSMQAAVIIELPFQGN